MSDKIAVVYIGDKPSKKDTVTGSRLVFPRHTAVDVESHIAMQLLEFPSVWRRTEELEDVKAQQEALEQAAIEEAERLAAEQARLAEEQSMVVGERDLAKMTSAQLATLMQMVSREQFLPTVRLHITGPLEVMLGEAVTEAAITFCRESALITLDRLLPSASAGSLVEVCNISGMTSCNVLHLTGEGGEPFVSGRDYFAMSANQPSSTTITPMPLPMASLLCSTPSQTAPGLTLSVQGTTELSSSRGGGAPAGSAKSTVPRPKLNSTTRPANTLFSKGPHTWQQLPLTRS